MICHCQLRNNSVLRACTSEILWEPFWRFAEHEAWSIDPLHLCVYVTSTVCKILRITSNVTTNEVTFLIYELQLHEA